jgi:hypothetical protein
MTDKLNGHRALAVALLATFSAACAGGEGRWAGTITDSAGITIVSNTTDAIWSPSEAWTVDEELRIGTLEGDPDYQFGRIGWIAVDSKNQIYALDFQTQQVQVYSADGEYVRTIGGRGAGPGEMQGAMFMFMGPADTLLVPDLPNQRVNRYAPDGSALESFRVSLEQGLPMLFKATASGVIAEQVRPFAVPGQPEIENPEDAIVLLASDGTVTDTVMKFPSGETISLGGDAPEIKFYSTEPIWEITDDLHLLYGVNEEYRIGFYSRSGDLERVLTMPYERKPVTDTDREVTTQFMERLWKDQGVPAQMIPQLRNMIKFGETFPAFSFIMSGPANTIWVQHVQPASELSAEELETFDLLQDTGAPDWDVFDAQGRFLGIVSMPPRFAPRLIRDDDIYGVWRDDLDVQYVVRLRIVGDLTAGST